MQLEIEPENVMMTIISLIKIAREEGHLEEEKRLLNMQLEIEPENVITIGSLIKIAREEGDLEEEKRLLNMQLEIEPENAMIPIRSLIRIAREEGDLEEEKRLLRRLLEINPEDVISISSLIGIAKEEGDTKEMERLLELRLKIEPQNIIALKHLAIIKKIKRDIEGEKKLLKKVLEIDPNDEIALERLKSIEKARGVRNEDIKMEVSAKEKDNIEKNILRQEEIKATPIGRARDLIYRSEDIILVAQDIKELIAEEKEEDKNFVLAELYAKAGTTDRARKLLTVYKRGLDPNTTKREYIELVNRAIELASSKGIKRFAWNEWWEQKREFGSIDGEDVSGNSNLRPRKDEGR